MAASKFPKRMGHIWIGPKPAPIHWMNTWPEKHPKWDYRVYDNAFLQEFPFRTRRLINEYFWRGEYAGVQDLMRYEILYEFGGFMADADAVCLHPIDKLVTKKGAYTVYDRPQEAHRGVSPFLACEPGNPLVGEVIDRLVELEPWELRKPFHSTGNLFLMRLIREWGEDKLTIFPSHYFIPWHHTDPEKVYDGPDTVYAEQKWGSATYGYNRGEGEGEEALSRNEVAERAAALRRSLITTLQPDLDPEASDAGGHDPARRDADARQMAYAGAMSDAGWEGRLKALNKTLVQRMKKAKQAPVFHGQGFYRYRQNQPLTESPLMSRAEPLRARVAAYLAGSQRALQIGVDTGHMLLLHKTLVPQARIAAFDACQPAGRNAARVDLYVPAAMEWLTGEFADDLRFLTGRPARVIANFRRLNRRWKFDLLHFNGIDDNFLKSYGAGVGALLPEGVILIHDMDPEAVRARVEELQLIGEVAEPVEFTDFGPGRGALAVLRRRPEASEALPAAAAQ